jgi:beta-1,4-mannooligosaccharide/beta-1,4-mannosyl-N-acetylglucosamine phosphorylase
LPALTISATDVEEGGEARLYYGAADTVIAVASAPVEDLIAACEPLA